MLFIDTNIAIALRDNDVDTRNRLSAMGRVPVISIMTRVELENGVTRDPQDITVRMVRRTLLDRFLATIEVQYFLEDDVLCYGHIVLALGHDRRLTIHRLIAAQAITRNASLITRNGKDFRTIDGLKLIEWGTPI